MSAEEGLETIQREAARLEALVLDLIDLGRMNKSEFSVRREPIDLAAAAAEAAHRYATKARSYGIDLETSVDDDAHAIGDADRILQVISNLVENALRVTPRGGRVRIVAAAGMLAVEDDGPGLKRDELPRAFERFYLTSRYRGVRPVGTGLGLAIVKQLVEGMGGHVDVASTPGVRTRFAVHLRVPHANDAASRTMPDDVLCASYARETVA